MKIPKIVNLLFIGLVILATGCRAALPQAEHTRIGVYDSRSIAIAYAGTEYFNQGMESLQQDYNEAKASGDPQRIAEIEAKGAEQQKILHMQAFSTYPVDEILVHISDLLPQVMVDAGVTLLVSKWDKETLAQYASAELVDVTLALVDLLNPSEGQRKSAIGIQDQPPIPLEDAANLED